VQTSEFARDDHKEAMQDFLEAWHPDESRVPIPRVDSVIDDPLEAIEHIEATFSDEGVQITINLESGPHVSDVLTPHAAKVVAFQILNTAWWAELAGG